MDTQEASLYNVVIVGAILLALVILYFVYTIVIQLRRNQEVLNTRHQAEIAAAESERLYMSRDLHDDLGPCVSTIAIFLSQMNPQTVEDKNLLQNCMGVVDDVVQKINHFSMSLVPSQLEELGIVSALEAFIEHLNNKELEIRLEYEELPELTPTQSLQVFRILQEIIHNSIKHASPGNLRIVLQTTDEDLLIKTADSGRPGNATGRKYRGSGMGIRNMKSRVAELKGEIHFNINPKTGTQYYIRIPLKIN